MIKPLRDLEGALEIIKAEDKTSENHICTQRPHVGFCFRQIRFMLGKPVLTSGAPTWRRKGAGLRDRPLKSLLLFQEGASRYKPDVLACFKGAVYFIFTFIKKKKTGGVGKSLCLRKRCQSIKNCSR